MKIQRTILSPKVDIILNLVSLVLGVMVFGACTVENGKRILEVWDCSVEIRECSLEFEECTPENG